MNTNSELSTRNRERSVDFRAMRFRSGENGNDCYRGQTDNIERDRAAPVASAKQTRADEWRQAAGKHRGQLCAQRGSAVANACIEQLGHESGLRRVHRSVRERE